MNIEKIESENSVTIFVSGRLDTLTAPEFESEIDKISEKEVSELIIDMKDLEYTSSAGLRTLLKAQKIMNGKGKFKIINVNETIMEVFKITGFSEILTIN